MGSILFFLGVATEIALAIFCITTKTNRKRLRNTIRIAAFFGFAVFIALNIVKWSFRYYILAAFLLLLAIIGAVRLIRNKEEKKAFKTSRIILKTVGMTVLLFIAVLPAILFPQNQRVIVPTGRFQVASSSYFLIDTNRIETYTSTGENRKLSIGLWYPENADGKYPLIVFSHGGFGVKSSNESLYQELASHGYVVCSIDHTYQCFFTTDVNGNVILMDSRYQKECLTESSLPDKQQRFEYYQKWMNIRTGDINFVIDYILDQAKSNDAEKGYKLLDTAKIGIMGHSMGGAAALGIGRTRNDVSAVIALESPYFCDIKGVENNEFVFKEEDYPLPVLNVYSDASWSHLDEWPQYVENNQLLSTEKPDVFNVHIKGAGHLSLTDLSLTSPFLTRMFNTFMGSKTSIDAEYCLKVINKISLEFFDDYLKDEGQFQTVKAY